jgi:hypothetical protein
VSKKKPKTIDASCPVTLMGCEGEVIVEMTPTEAVSMLEKAWQENKRLRQENATLTAERDAARRELCRNEAIIRLQRHRVHRDSEDVVGLTKEISVERGWDCFKKKP